MREGKSTFKKTCEKVLQTIFVHDILLLVAETTS